MVTLVVPPFVIGHQLRIHFADAVSYTHLDVYKRQKLGIPLEEQMALSGMAVDAVMDSVSVKTTFKETLLP